MSRVHDAPDAWQRRVSGRADGVTLIELLVTIAIVGFAFVALLTGIGTFFKVSAAQRAHADLDAVARQYVEQVTAPQTAYAGCSGTPYTTVTLPTGYAFSAGPTVSYWKGDNPATFSATCATDNPNGVQQVTATITRTSPATPARSTSVVFTKRNLS